MIYSIMAGNSLPVAYNYKKGQVQSIHIA